MAIAVALTPFGALAQEPPTVADTAGEASTKAKTQAAEKLESGPRSPGWNPGISIGASFNLVDTRAVVGQPDGTSVTIGGGLDASLEYNEDQHEWRNNLVAAAGTTRTPAIDEFIKTNDGLMFESIYLIHLLETLGPFARVGLTTQMFSATDIQAAPVDYEVQNLDGTTSNFTGRRLALTEAFQPLTLRESLGAFWQPVRISRISLETRAGIGALETFASGLAVSDNADTPLVEVTELGDSFAVGAEGVLNMWGFFDDEKRLSYTAGIGVLVPFVTSALPAGDERGIAELVVLETNVGLNAKLFDWASVSYRFNVTRQPLLLDEFQISNSVLLTIGAAFGSKAPKPEPPVCDCEAKPVVLAPKSSTESAKEPDAAPAAAEPVPPPVAAPSPVPAPPAEAEPPPIAEPAPATPDAPTPDPR